METDKSSIREAAARTRQLQAAAALLALHRSSGTVLKSSMPQPKTQPSDETKTKTMKTQAAEGPRQRARRGNHLRPTSKANASSEAKNEATPSRRTSTNMPSVKENEVIDDKLAPAPKDEEPQRMEGQEPRRSIRLLDKARQRGELQNTSAPGPANDRPVKRVSTLAGQTDASGEQNESSPTQVPRLREAAQKQPKTTEKRRREAESATREQPKRKRQRTSRAAKPASQKEDETTPLTEIPRPQRKHNLARRAPAAAAGS